LAIKKESEYVDQYKKNLWKILNKNKTGGTGSNNLYWTEEKCQIESLKYKNRTDFWKFSNGAYESSKSHGWLNKICGHMEIKKHSNGYWTLEKLQEEALKYKTRMDFKNNCSGGYAIACRTVGLNVICLHMSKN
jgi:hypothetical protein